MGKFGALQELAKRGLKLIDGDKPAELVEPVVELAKREPTQQALMAVDNTALTLPRESLQSATYFALDDALRQAPELEFGGFVLEDLAQALPKVSKSEADAYIKDTAAELGITSRQVKRALKALQTLEPESIASKFGLPADQVSAHFATSSLTPRQALLSLGRQDYFPDELKALGSFSPDPKQLQARKQAIMQEYRKNSPTTWVSVDGLDAESAANSSLISELADEYLGFYTNKVAEPLTQLFGPEHYKRLTAMKNSPFMAPDEAVRSALEPELFDTDFELLRSFLNTQ